MQYHIHVLIGTWMSPTVKVSYSVSKYTKMHYHLNPILPNTASHSPKPLKRTSAYRDFHPMYVPHQKIIGPVLCAFYIYIYSFVCQETHAHATELVITLILCSWQVNDNLDGQECKAWFMTLLQRTIPSTLWVQSSFHNRDCSRCPALAPEQSWNQDTCDIHGSWSKPCARLHQQPSCALP